MPIPPQARMREISRRTLASNSFSSRRCFTRSPILTMPFSSLSSITGKWRIRAVVIVASTASTRSEERQLIMRVDISCWTSKLSTAAPSRAAALMKSRSENMPTGFIHRSSTIRAPMRCSARKPDAAGGVYLHNVMAFDPQNVGNKHSCLLRSGRTGAFWTAIAREQSFDQLDGEELSEGEDARRGAPAPPDPEGGETSPSHPAPTARHPALVSRKPQRDSGGSRVGC